MSEQKLKPCPFCGEKAVLERYKSKLYGERYWVTCGFMLCPVKPSTGISDKEHVIEAWNRRANDEQADC